MAKKNIFDEMDESDRLMISEAMHNLRAAKVAALEGAQGIPRHNFTPQDFGIPKIDALLLAIDGPADELTSWEGFELQELEPDPSSRVSDQTACRDLMRVLKVLSEHLLSKPPGEAADVSGCGSAYFLVADAEGKVRLYQAPKMADESVGLDTVRRADDIDGLGANELWSIEDSVRDREGILTIDYERAKEAVAQAYPSASAPRG